MRVEVREHFETERAQMNGEIANILKPAQLEIFEREIVRMRRERRGSRSRDGRPRGRRVEERLAGRRDGPSGGGRRVSV